MAAFYRLPFPKSAWLLNNSMVLEFGLGVGVGYLIKHKVTALWRVCLALSAALFPYAASKTTATFWVGGLEEVAIFGGSALAIYAIAAAELRGVTLFRKPLQDLGDMSYSLYVWHFPGPVLAHQRLCAVNSWPIQLAPGHCRRDFMGVVEVDREAIADMGVAPPKAAGRFGKLVAVCGLMVDFTSS